MSSQLLDPPSSTWPQAEPIGLRLSGMLMSPEEFDAIPPGEWDADYRYESIHGVLIVTPPPGYGERRTNDELVVLLLNYRTQHAEGQILRDTVNEQTIATRTGRRRADRVVWLRGDPAESPSIVIEFVADSARDRRRDYIEKREEYALIGVKEYWVIDPFRRQMTIFRGPTDEILVNGNESYRTDLLPGFELPLARLLSPADVGPPR